MKYLKLKSGYTMPAIGLGTWLLSGKDCYETVLTALEDGYRHIDTAVAYENEVDIGKALKDVAIPREELFLTSKSWYTKLRFKDVIEQCNRSLEYLNTDYLDLLLIHWPNRSIPLSETLKAFEELVELRKVRSIGVSNFNTHHLEDVLSTTALPLCINQIEFHPFLKQQSLFDFCNDNGIVITAYSPLAHGKVFSDPTFAEIAKKINCNPGTLALAWLLHKNCAIIPKASTEEHIKENLKADEISLNAEIIEQIDLLPEQQRVINPSWADFNY
jgi:diketogulonate reductase-like aldo/keto reductase